MTNAEKTFSLLNDAMFVLSRFDMDGCPDKMLKEYVSASIRMLHRGMLRACSMCVPFKDEVYKHLNINEERGSN